MQRRNFIKLSCAGLAGASLFSCGYRISFGDAFYHPELRQAYINNLSRSLTGSDTYAGRFIYEGDDAVLASLSKKNTLAMIDDPRGAEYVKNVFLREDFIDVVL